MVTKQDEELDEEIIEDGEEGDDENNEEMAKAIDEIAESTDPAMLLLKAIMFELQALNEKVDKLST